MSWEKKLLEKLASVLDVNKINKILVEVEIFYSFRKEWESLESCLVFLPIEILWRPREFEGYSDRRVNESKDSCV